MSNKPKYLHKNFVILLLIIFICQACGIKGETKYNDGTLRTAEAVYMGTIVNVSEVKVEANPGYLGALSGGVAGGVIGVLLRGVSIAGFKILSGATLPVIAGATAGSIIGGANESITVVKNATELTVELANRNVFIIVIPNNNEYFIVGDQVRIISLQDELVKVQHIRK